MQTDNIPRYRRTVTLPPSDGSAQFVHGVPCTGHAEADALMRADVAERDPFQRRRRDWP